MTLVDSTSTESAAFAADAEQAAYFRSTLVAQRDQLLAMTGHNASQALRAETEARYIDRMIAGLDRRFSAYWSNGE